MIRKSGELLLDPLEGITVSIAFIVLLASGLLETASWGMSQGLLVASGLVASIAISRFASHQVRQPLLIALLIAFCSRALLSIGAYFVSYWRLPILPSLQNAPGYWDFAWDPVYYDEVGRRIAAAIEHGIPAPTILAERGFFVLVGLVYSLLGPHPLNVVLLNSLWGMLGAVAVFSAARAIGCSPQAALIPTVSVSLWPSGLLWSSQMLKDPMGAAVVLSIMAFIVNLTHRDRSRETVTFWSIAAILLLGLVGQFRAYVGLACLAGIALTGSGAVLFRRLHRRAVIALGTVLLLGSIALAAGRATNPVAFAEYLRQQALEAGTDRQSEQSSQKTAEPGLVPGAEELIGAARAEISRVTPERAGRTRDSFLRSHGASFIDPEFRVQDLEDVIRYYPRALMVALLAPFPWQWLEAGTVTGILRPLASIETMLNYFVLAAFVILGVRTHAYREPGYWFAALFLVAGCAYLAVAVPNLGTLFRLRLQFLLPAVGMTLALLARDGWRPLVPAPWLPGTQPAGSCSPRTLEALLTVPRATHSARPPAP